MHRSKKLLGYLWRDSIRLPYLLEYNAQNFVLNFNQKLRVRVIHEFFHQHTLFLFLFFSFIIFLRPLLILFAAMRNLCFFLFKNALVILSLCARAGFTQFCFSHAAMRALCCNAITISLVM